jgi:C-terminal processing protease CtpA/Prc
VRINDHFMVGVPSGRAINPYSKTDWEGTGVEPDVKVPAEKALKTAHLMALEKELPKLESPDLKEAVGAAIQKLKKELAEKP